MADYRVNVYDRGDRYGQTTATDWAHCLQIAELYGRIYPGKTIEIHNADRADYCHELGAWDGLTDAERAAAEEAVERGRGTRVTTDPPSAQEKPAGGEGGG